MLRQMFWFQAVRATTMCLVGVLVLAGCRCPEPSDLTPHAGVPQQYTHTPADITYHELARRYNEGLASVDHLWARTKVDLAWYEEDEDGGRTFRTEQGDGKFMFRRPDETALLVEKFGKTYLWAGANGTHYWLFDQVDRGNKKAYLGSFARLYEPGRRPFPLPVRSDTVPVLFGLMPLPAPDALAQPPAIDLYNGQYLVELRSAGLRMMIDPATFRPTRVDLLDTSGFSAVIATLQGGVPIMPGQGGGEVGGPGFVLCQRADVYVSGYASRLTVELKRATDGAGRLRDAMFDFDRLKRSFKPDTVLSLDPR